MTLQCHEGLEAVIPLSEIETALPLAEVYDAVEFLAEPAEEGTGVGAVLQRGPAFSSQGKGEGLCLSPLCLVFRCSRREALRAGRGKERS